MSKKNNSGYENSGHWNSGDRNSGNENSGNGNSGNENSGNWNSGNWNSGIFNTDMPKMRSFNRECRMTYKEFLSSDLYIDFSLQINVYVFYSKMSDEEKNNHEYAKITGGYLKTLSYKESWKKWWKENKSDEMIKKIKKLPNFNPDIFEEITGINIDSDNDKIKKAIKFLEEKGKIKNGKILI